MVTPPPRSRSAVQALLATALLAASLLAHPLSGQEGYDVHHPTAQLTQYGQQALTLCNGLFVSERDLEEIYEGELARMSRPLAPSRIRIDESTRGVEVGVGGNDPTPVMRAVWREGLGCIVLSPDQGLEDAEGLPSLPTRERHQDPETIPWPRGDRIEDAPPPSDVEIGALEAAWDWARNREAHGGHADQETLSLLVVHRGRIVFEDYAPGIEVGTMTRTWSAAKSLAATLIGIGVDRGLLELDAPLSFEWRPDELNEYRRRHASGFDMISWEDWPPGDQAPAPDPRSRITLRHVLHMSSGLYPVDNEWGSAMGSSLCYFGGWDCGAAARDRGLVREPGALWDYENHDTLLGVLALRSALDDDEAFLRFPREALLDRLGMHHTVPGVDRFGTYVMSSQVYMNARDLARLGLLHLQEGVWEGEQVVSRDWVHFVRTPAPSTEDFGHFYGGQWWLVPDDRSELPQDAYTAAGAGGQYAIVVPSHDLVVVRRGLDRGSALSAWDLLEQVLEAFPETSPQARKFR